MHYSSSRTDEFARNLQELLLSVRESPSQLDAGSPPLPCGVLLADAPSGRLLFANHLAAELFAGMLSPASDRNGSTPQRGLVPDVCPYVAADWPLTRAIQGEITTDQEIALVRPDGTLRVVSASAAPLRDGDGNIVAGVMVFADASEQRAAEQRLRDLGDLALRLSASLTLDDVCRVTLDRAIATLGGYAGVVTLLRENATLEVCAQVGYPEREIEAFRVIPFDRRPVVPVIDAARTNEAVMLSCVEEWDARYPGTRSQSSTTQALVAVPMSVGDRVTGVLGLSFRTARRFSGADRAFMSALAHECGLALERAALYDRERLARAEAEEASRAKDMFLATLSHELRTPLNAILGWAQVLRLTASTEQQIRGVDTIERNARAQARLIDDMLDVSRIVAGKLQLEIEPVALAPIVAHVVEAARPGAEARRVQIVTRIETDVCTVPGDATRLQQVVWNLVANAVKFTPGEGRVDVRLERAGSNARITVSDEGEGIAPQVLPYIFDYFRQGDAGAARAHCGLGLGLAIARHIVELHGGSVSAHSDGPGRGATFVVKLPLANERRGRAGAKRPASRSADESATLKGIHILLVEDADDSRELATLLLESRGARVSASPDAAQAFEVVRQERPDVIIADIGLPGEDGLSFIRRIRVREQREGLDPIPAAALTAYASADDRRRALVAGFNVHVPKPVDAEELTTLVTMLAGRRGSASDPT